MRQKMLERVMGTAFLIVAINFLLFSIRIFSQSIPTNELVLVSSLFYVFSTIAFFIAGFALRENGDSLNCAT